MARGTLILFEEFIEDLGKGVHDLDTNSVDSAKFKVVINATTGDFQIDLGEPVVSNGIYRFESVKLPKEGMWNILVKVKIDDLYRFYNLKANTVTKEIFNKFEKIQVGKKTKKLLK